MNCRLQIILRPYVDRIGDGAAAMIEIDGTERIVLVRMYLIPSARPACTVANAVV